MLSRREVEAVDVYSPDKVKLPPKTVIRGCKFLVVMRKFGRISNLVKKFVSEEDDPLLTFFFDDVGDLFLSDFDSIPGILHRPISALLFKTDCLEIIFPDFILKSDISQVNPVYLQKSHWFKEQNDVDESSFNNPEDAGPSFKRPRLDCSELPAELSTTASLTLGIPSEMSQSMSSAIESSNEQPASADLEEYSSITEWPLLDRSRSDRNASNVLEVELCKTKIEKLFDCQENSHLEQLVPTSQMISTKNYEDNDLTIKGLVKQLDSNDFFPNCDPIVLVRCETGYEVVSGSRRVHALKLKGIHQFRAKVIQQVHSQKFLLTQFLSECEKPEKEQSDVNKMIGCTQSLFSYLSLDHEMFSKWTKNDIHKVFGRFYIEKTKSYYILMLFKSADLTASIANLAKTTNFVIPTLRLILSKFRINPAETMKVLLDEDHNSSEPDLRKHLKSVEIDVELLLKKKNVSYEVIKETVAKFSCDAQFEQFLRQADLRLKRISVDVIGKMFETFKSKNDKNLSSSQFPTLITVSEHLSDSEAIVTFSSDTAVTFLSHRDTGLAFLVGKRDDTASSCHCVILPDELSTMEDDESLSNFFSLSIYTKHEGTSVIGIEQTTFLRNLGVANRAMMTFSELGSLFNDCSSIYFDVTLALLQEKFVLHLMKCVRFIQVPNVNVKEYLMMRLPSMSRPPS